LSNADKPSDQEASDKRKKAVSGAQSYAKYSGVAIQMIVILLLFVYGGRFLDGHFETSIPYFTIAGSLVGIGLALYVPLRNLMR
jgi:F0F1-type ATP synthase assembly protein I